MSPDPERNVSIKSVSPKTSNGPCKCCKCCTWKCCAISQTVILCIIGGKWLKFYRGNMTDLYILNEIEVQKSINL